MLAILIIMTAILYAEGEKSKRMNGNVNFGDWAGKYSDSYPYLLTCTLRSVVFFFNKHSKIFIMNLNSERKKTKYRKLAFFTLNSPLIPLDLDCVFMLL